MDLNRIYKELEKEKISVHTHTLNTEQENT